MLDTSIVNKYNCKCKVFLLYTNGSFMEKDLTLTELFDIYGDLLTERQKELFSSYYLYDLSLSEIAIPEGKTRQNVYDSLKKVKDKLISYERILNVKSKNDQIKQLANDKTLTKSELVEKILEIIGG